MDEWRVLIGDDGLEVVPLNDRRAHRRGRACWCAPQDDDGVLVHNSADRRELLEGEA